MQLAGRERRAFALATFLLAGGAQAATGVPESLRGRVQACAACHGDNGNSTTAGTPSLAGQPPTFFELQMILFREGLRASPSMESIAADMSDGEISALAAHYAAQKPRPPAGRPDKALYAKGRALAREHHCGTCHLPDYRGRAQMPRLAGQREDYLAAAMTAYRDNKRSGSDTSMNGVMYGVSDADIRALAHYLAHVRAAAAKPLRAGKSIAWLAKKTMERRAVFEACVQEDLPACFPSLFIRLFHGEAACEIFALLE